MPPRERYPLELNNRASFIDFCQGLLNLNPIERWSPQQARLHPFITGEKFTKPFVVSRNDLQPTRDHFFHAPYQPSGHPSQQPVASSAVSPTTATSDPKRPFGGLVPSQPKGTRAFQDAASYNQHLAQHQAYTAQAQAASQAANNVFRNPYITTQPPSQPSSSAYPASAADSGNTYSQPPQPQHAQYAAGSQSQGASFWKVHQCSHAILQDRTIVAGHHSNPTTHLRATLRFHLI